MFESGLVAEIGVNAYAVWNVIKAHADFETGVAWPGIRRLVALVHRLSTWASVDLDFSMHHDFPNGIDEVKGRINKVLTETFQENGFEVFDFKMLETPVHISEDMADFWGGYGV